MAKYFRRYIRHLLPAGASLFALGHICYMLSYGMLFFAKGYSLVEQGVLNGGLVIGVLFIGTGMLLGCVACIKWGRKRIHLFSGVSFFLFRKVLFLLNAEQNSARISE